MDYYYIFRPPSILESNYGSLRPLAPLTFFFSFLYPPFLIYSSLGVSLLQNTVTMAAIDVSGMSEQIQAEVQVKQFRDFLVQYNKLSESCFNACVWDFTSRSVRSGEESCVQNCVEKYTKVGS